MQAWTQHPWSGEQASPMYSCTAPLAGHGPGAPCGVFTCQQLVAITGGEPLAWYNRACLIVTRVGVAAHAAVSAPCRDPSVLHARVLGVLRLLGPRHWASWRLLLLGVELHCGALEEAAIKAQVRPAQG
jgi:hypothetical protein